MPMVVRTNYSALNATRNLGLNNKALDGSLEKLASGYKVNKAADDASGLAISEKMKAQIKALDTASANAEDGISFIQTAEGYLNEIHNMLNRMVTLAMKAANGTTEGVSNGSGVSYSNSGVMQAGGTDRDALQIEMDQLCAEIDRIANTANFNNVRLFDGGLAIKAYDKITSCKTFGVGSSGTQVGAGGRDIKDSFNGLGISGYSTSITIGKGVGLETSGLRLQIGETSREADKLKVGLMDMNTAALFAKLPVYKNGDGSLSATSGGGAGGSTVGKLDLVQYNTKNTSMQNGRAVTGYTINISSQDVASLASDAIRQVINNVSKQRADLGGLQNRLEYTINNLDTASENISNANSRIRDTDVAKEMARYTKANVLVQSATSMLAQANGRTQQALQLMG